MKKFFSFLVWLLFTLCFFQAYASGLSLSALKNEANKASSARVVPENGIEILIDDQYVTLNFDPSEEFSSITDGMVQASFYAYGADSEYLYEMYLVFPQNITSNTTVTPEYAIQNNAPDCSVVMLVSTADQEQYFFSSQMSGSAFPENTGYAITFTNVSVEADRQTCVGSLTASMAEIDLLTGAVTDTFSIVDAPFNFTIPLSDSENYQTPQTPNPSPVPTVGLDFRKV